MEKKIVWSLLGCLVVLSILLASCAPAAPVAPTTPTAPATPAIPTTPTTTAAPTTPATSTATGAEMVKVTLKKLDSTVVEKMMEKPKYGGAYTTVHSEEPTVFDPALASVSSALHNQTNDRLIAYDWIRGPTGTGETTFNITLDVMTYQTGFLAESWEVPDDATIILHLRKGVRYGLDPNSEASRLVGGRELTAEDVVFSWTRNFSDIPKNYWRARQLPAEWPVSVTAPDKYTVIVKSNPGYIGTVISQVITWHMLYPPEPVKKYGDLREWKYMVGTGPFMLQDIVPGSSVTFVRNPNYWQKDPFFPQNQLPYVDTLKYLFIKDTSTLIAAVRTGKVDNLYQKTMVSPDDKNSLLRTNPQMQFRRIGFNAMALKLVMNNPQLPWYDIRVRRALNMAIDREAIARDYYGGEAEIMGAPISPSEFPNMYTPLKEQPESVQEMYTYNPEKAKKLLAEAGYPNGFKMKVDTSTQYDVDLLQLVKFYFAKISVNLEIAIKERAVYTSMTAGRTVMEAGWDAFDSDGPYAYHYWTPTDPAAYGQIEPPQHTEHLNYLMKARDETMKVFMFDETAAWPIMKKMFVYTLEQAWLVHMPSPYKYVLWQPWLKGYAGESVTGRGQYLGGAKYLWIDRELKKKMGF
ncbi:MAG: ABC transporter substrate-binding protein [Chloroflexi bacterium]|nr:ABC transporter substrate-binding protein [Chloroflexota bacterium]